MVNAITHIDIKPTWLTMQRFVARCAAAIAVASAVVLGIRLRFNNHAPQKLATFVAFHEQAANELRCNHLCWAAEEGVGEVLGERGWLWEWLGEEVLRNADVC